MTDQEAPVPPSPHILGEKVDEGQVHQWILDLKDLDKREQATLQLNKIRDMVPDLGLWLWHSFGSMTALLQEVLMIYPSVVPPTLTAEQSNRVCNAVALMQCVAGHKETRTPFLNAHIPQLLYPILHTVEPTRPFECVRLTSLGVIGALVKADEQEAIQFLLTTEIIPLCLGIMENGSELTKTVSTFILLRILLDEAGLAHVCEKYERFTPVASVLGNMVLQLAKAPSARLLKHVVRCYARLSDSPQIQQGLRKCLPDQLRDETFSSVVKGDKTTEQSLNKLMQNLGLPALTH